MFVWHQKMPHYSKHSLSSSPLPLPALFLFFLTKKKEADQIRLTTEASTQAYIHTCLNMVNKLEQKYGLAEEKFNLNFIHAF